MHNNTYAYSEIFDSIQGEGEYTGYPTAWLRFYLCNLQCNGFSQDDPTDPSTYKLPYKDFDIIEIKDLKELPVWEYGCDSSYSWSKKFKHLQEKKTSREIADLIRREFTNEHNKGKWLDRHMCFTGGEPLMKHAQLCTMEVMQHYLDDGDSPKFITYETNGTQMPRAEFVEFWQNYPGELMISCSPKLFNVAGETTKRAIRPEVVAEYMKFADKGYLKFVLTGHKAAWDELDETVEKFRAAGVDWPVWIMPVGALEETQKENAAMIAEQTMIRGYNVSARVHCYIWGNQIGT